MTRSHRHESAAGSTSSRLNGLTEADLVCKQDARTDPTEDGERGFELMRQEIDPRVHSGLQPAGWAIRGEKTSTGAAPLRRPHQARVRATVDGIYGVEGSENTALDADIRRRDTGKRDELAVI